MASSPTLLAGQDMTADLMAPPAWIAMPLVNSWVNVGAGATTAQYRLWKLYNSVEIIGSIKGGASATACFQLPAGYIPATTSNNPCYGGTSTNCYIFMDTSGNINIENFTAGQSIFFHFWISLDA